MLASSYVEIRNSLNSKNQKLLSICIATLNRGNYIGETLRNVLEQCPNDVEVLVLDGNSQDTTEEVIQSLQKNYSNLFYLKEPKNSGVDMDYDKAVLSAEGEYCWLFTDDDLLCDGSVAKVLAGLESRPDLLIANAAVYTKDFKTILLERFMPTKVNQTFTAAEFESFFRLSGPYLSFIGGVIIKKSIWEERDRANYYGSLFIHVGVIFQKPFLGSIQVIAQPLIKIRYGNAMWTSRGFEIWMLKWPNLVDSFQQFSLEARTAVCSKKLFRTLKYLVFYRAMGIYTFEDYKKLISEPWGYPKKTFAILTLMLPSFLLSPILALYLVLFNNKNLIGLYDLLNSKSSHSLTQWIIYNFSSLKREQNA